MFLSQPLVEVLVGRGVVDIDAFLQVPTWNDLPDPFSIASMEKATARVLGAIRNRKRITIFGERLRWNPWRPHLTQRTD
jgi:single-stranded-DNA-specific exonuclease